MSRTFDFRFWGARGAPKGPPKIEVHGTYPCMVSSKHPGNPTPTIFVPPPENQLMLWNVSDGPWRGRACAGVACRAEAACGPAEERLIDEIFKVRRYQKLARPVRKESEAVDVVFGLSLQQIIAVVGNSLCLSLVSVSRGVSGFRLSLLLNVVHLILRSHFSICIHFTLSRCGLSN